MIDRWSSRRSSGFQALVCGLGVLGSLAAGLSVAPLAGAAEIGVAAAVNTDAFGTPPGQTRMPVVLGRNVVFNEQIDTDGSGLVQVLLVDGSTFTVGANSSLVIDEFVYDPASGSGKLVADFGKGVARFVGGKLSKSRGGVSVNTPVGTIGIRGGIANLNLEGDAPVFSLLFGDELTFTGPDGRTTRVYRAGYSMVIGEGRPPTVRRTTPADLAKVQAGLTGPGQNGGIGNPPTSGQVNRPGGPSTSFPPGQVPGRDASGPGRMPPNVLQDVGRRLPKPQKAEQRRLTNQLRRLMEEYRERHELLE